MLQTAAVTDGLKSTSSPKFTWTDADTSRVCITASLSFSLNYCTNSKCLQSPVVLQAIWFKLWQLHSCRCLSTICRILWQLPDVSTFDRQPLLFNCHGRTAHCSVFVSSTITHGRSRQLSNSSRQLSNTYKSACDSIRHIHYGIGMRNISYVAVQCIVANTKPDWGNPPVVCMCNRDGFGVIQVLSSMLWCQRQTVLSESTGISSTAYYQTHQLALWPTWWRLLSNSWCPVASPGISFSLKPDPFSLLHTIGLLLGFL